MVIRIFRMMSELAHDWRLGQGVDRSDTIVDWAKRCEKHSEDWRHLFLGQQKVRNSKKLVFLQNESHCNDISTFNPIFHICFRFWFFGSFANYSSCLQALMPLCFLINSTFPHVKILRWSWMKVDHLFSEIPSCLLLQQIHWLHVAKCKTLPTNCDFIVNCI